MNGSRALERIRAWTLKEADYTVVIHAWLHPQLATIWFSPLRKVPGPWYTLFTIWFYKRAHIRGRPIQYVQAMRERYGTVIRLGPKVVCVIDRDVLRTVLQSSDFRKGRVYTQFGFNGHDSVFSMRDPLLHRQRARIIAPLYSSSSLRQMEPLILEAGIRPLVRRLDGHAAADDVVDMKKLFAYMAYDVISELCYGKSFQLLQQDNHPMPKHMSNTMVLAVRKQFFGAPLARLLAPSLSKSERLLSDYTEAAIEEAKGRLRERRDLLCMLLEAQDPDTGEHLSNGAVASEMTTNM
ncbi:cytochrome P450 [Thamnocephalis sphaerospora]|uniref:Cytochrome P450 n=1 Tax=Thamnocephalis sphaerospora TaxID=78915 RepID=A0A4P9XKU0_9FUNG|nr:cytochrome P450 [Thamnocephalis sphaerospora]|eukprot:RKP06428.1 cytochrome P450 [Thamnocephalis sphaerospora]